MTKPAEIVPENPPEATTEKVSLARETAHVEKAVRATGKVQVTTRTELVRDHVTATLESTEVEITEVEIGSPVTEAPDVRREGDVTIVPIVEEVIVVEKRLVLARELHIRPKRKTETVDVPVTLRRQVAQVERSGPGDAEEPGGPGSPGDRRPSDHADTATIPRATEPSGG